MGKVVITILQGSAVTQTMLGGLTICPPVANFLHCICAKNYENWLEAHPVVAENERRLVAVAAVWKEFGDGNYSRYLCFTAKSAIVAEIAVWTGLKAHLRCVALRGER